MLNVKAVQELDLYVVSIVVSFGREPLSYIYLNVSPVVFSL